MLKDSNAAGDSFVGGFLAKICQFEEKPHHQNNKYFSREELTSACKIGNIIAGEVI